MIPMLGMIVCGIGLVGFGAWYFWPNAIKTTLAWVGHSHVPPPPAAPPSGAPTLVAANSSRAQRKAAAKAEAPEAERTRRGALLSKLRQLYMASHDGISSEMMAGLEDPPAAWVNAELGKLGETWRVPEASPHRSTPGAYLVRSLEDQGAHVDWEGLTTDGSHAGTSDQLASLSINRFVVQVENHGPDLLAWRFQRIVVRKDGQIIFNKTKLPLKQLYQGNKEMETIYIVPGSPMHPDTTKNILISYTIEYDTVPSTGTRVIQKDISEEVIWHPPGQDSPIPYASSNQIVTKAKEK